MQPFPVNCPLGFCQANGRFLGSPHFPQHLASNSSLWYGGQASENRSRWPLSTGPATCCLAQHCHHLVGERTDVGSKGCGFPTHLPKYSRGNVSLCHLVSKRPFLRCIWEEGPWPLCFDGTLTTVSEAPLSYLHGNPPNLWFLLCAPHLALLHWSGCYHAHPHGSMEPSIWFLGGVGEGGINIPFCGVCPLASALPATLVL